MSVPGLKPNRVAIFVTQRKFISVFPEIRVLTGEGIGAGAYTGSCVEGLELRF